MQCSKKVSLGTKADPDRLFFAALLPPTMTPVRKPSGLIVLYASEPCWALVAVPPHTIRATTAVNTMYRIRSPFSLPLHAIHTTTRRRRMTRSRC
jgi:hypothetical protein